MKRVLAVTNFSDLSINILDFGQVLFEKIPTTFYLLNIYKNSSDNEYEGEWLNKWAEEVIIDFNKILKEIKKHNKNSNHFFKSISKPFPFIDSINEAVLSNDIDVIILPTTETRGDAETFLSTKVVTVLNKIKSLPIILVPKGHKVKKPTQIIFSTNFKRAFNRNELEILVVLAKSLRCKIHIVQVMTDNLLDDFQRVNKDYLKDIFNGVDFYFEKVKVKSTETAAIGNFVLEMESDMVSLVNHKYNFLQKLTKENVVKKVAFNCKVPLLVLPELVEHRPFQ